MSPVLVVVCGLPGTGKSTLAHRLAKRLKTPYLRVDRIEHAIVAWSSLTHPVGPAGYAVAYELSGEQLALGLDVIVECVNPIALTRDSWAATAEAADGAIIEVELICSDPAGHRRRVETRLSDVVGLVKPRWVDVMDREYEPWNRQYLVFDTAAVSVEEMVGRVTAEVTSARLSSSS